MKLVKRYDYSGSVSAETETTPEGFLKVFARATRVGVLKYKQMDGTTIRELRHPDEVFKPESMATLALKPMTNNHPPGLIDSETASMYQIGTTGETVTVDDDRFLKVMTVITDKRAIGEYEAGKVEVSPGYVCELDFTPGTFDGEEYDAVQRKIRYNHLAIVRKGRSGPEVRLDAGDAAEIDETVKEKKKMKMKLAGKDYDMEDELGAAINKHVDAMKEEVEEKAKKDAAGGKAELEKVAKEKEKADARADGLEAELAKLKAERADAADPAKVREAARARRAIEKVAEAAGVEKFDEMDDISLKRAVILAQHADAKLDGKSDEYINARFDVASESALAADDKAKSLGRDITGGGRRASETLDAEDSRQKMIERNRGLWKTESKAAKAE